MQILILPDLKYEGYSLDRWNWAEWKYKGLDITCHLTIPGGTRLRLEWYKDDPAKWKLLADWCLGNEGLMSDVYLVIGFAALITAIDNHITGQLPLRSDLRPIWNDPEFMEVFNTIHKKIDPALTHAVYDRIVQDNRKVEFLKKVKRL